MRKKLTRVEEFKLNHSKEEFYEAYMKFSQTEMIDKYNLYPDHVYQLLDEYDLPRRTKQQGYEIRNRINTEKYGGNCPLCSEECRKKRDENNLKKYGTIFPNQVPEIKQKAIETNIRNHNGVYSTADPEVREKAKKTCQKKYGTASPNAAESVKEKRKATCQEKYGVDNIFKDKSYIKNCCINKFGEDNYFKTEEFQEKARATCREKYGADFYTQTEESKENLRQKLPQAIRKSKETRDRNHTWNSSRAEKYLFENLSNIFPVNDILKEYIDTRYAMNDKRPFKCDFYIKSLDLFIELNFYIAHGPHPYNALIEEDQQLLDSWKSKCGTYINSKNEEILNSYYGYIETWTKKDPLKISIARKNKLNYIAVYSQPENQLRTLDELINSLKIDPKSLCKNEVIIWQ